MQQPGEAFAVPARIENRKGTLGLGRVPVVAEIAGIEHDAKLGFGLLFLLDVVQPQNADPAAVAPEHIQDQLDGGRFAGTVGADQAHDVPFGQGEADVAELEPVKGS